jgi:hypothetical protein
MSFYLYLPSNGSQRYFPDNRISKFRIKTPIKLNLSNYEVALTEVTYVYSRKTFTGLNSDNNLKIRTGDINDFSEKEFSLTHYASIPHLVDELNECVYPLTSVHFSFSERQNRTRITLKPNTGLQISEKLSYTLGFAGKTKFESSSETHQVSDTSPDLNSGSYSMFIYTDIVQSQIVGSELVPLLRVLTLEKKENEAVTTTFQNPYYLPLSRSDFDIISVVLCDEFGEELILDKGQVTLTLHFRKLNSG